MLHTRSIRFQLTIWYAAALAAALGLFGGLIWTALRYRLINEIDRDLDGRAGRFEQFFRVEAAHLSGVELREELNEFSQALPPGSFLRLTGSSGFDFRYPVVAPPMTKQDRLIQRQFSAHGEVFQLQTGSPAGDVLHTLSLLRLLLLSLSPLVILLACAGGAWLSRRALRPVEQVTAAALTISIENLSERLPVPATGDEIARLTEVLNTMLYRLDSAVQTLSQFAADASHELRTPLAVIRTTAELALRRERTQESYRGSLQEIACEAERMTCLVEDLLLLARGDDAMTKIAVEPIDLRDVMRDACLEMRSLADLRQIQIRFAFDDEPAVISGSYPAVRRLLLALLDNAVKHSAAGTDVIAQVRIGEGTIQAAVEDFGAGIGAADLPHIFKRFYRADKARSGGGHGLGLALAESIARAHGARIEVHSIEGVTSRFRVLFPQTAAAIQQAAPAPFGAVSPL